MLNRKLKRYKASYNGKILYITAVNGTSAIFSAARIFGLKVPAKASKVRVEQC